MSWPNLKFKLVKSDGSIGEENSWTGRHRLPLTHSRCWWTWLVDWNEMQHLKTWAASHIPRRVLTDLRGSVFATMTRTRITQTTNIQTSKLMMPEMILVNTRKRKLTWILYYRVYNLLNGCLHLRGYIRARQILFFTYNKKRLSAVTAKKTKLVQAVLVTTKKLFYNNTMVSRLSNTIAGKK